MRRAILVAATVCWTVTVYAAEFSGSVDKIADGDTFWVCDTTACHKIRLCGIDAPEPSDPGYRASAEGLKQLVKGQVVRASK
jgi:endonuclease YncB( thermonuclease family)